MSTPAWIGSYRIERLLGTGSFATVWLGHDPVLGWSSRTWGWPRRSPPRPG
ncbi:hypothetical protein ACIG87_11610 [Micromonospora sp. NPDC051925]|uniref:hypothetical protein n=1 Tax=Micromonospora sp. NPDC051925 TaxID=3364288 RepID=UPI0037C9224E